MSAIVFGRLMKSLRQRTGKTMRDFCLENGFDPGNYSRLERGIFPPPQREDILERYATALGLARGSDEWLEFFDVAAASRGELPRDLSSDERLLEKLPVLFRTLRGSQVPPEKLDDLIEKIRRAWS
ncbi:MAG: helix-turn-helix transcriptional regulator [Planctomycetia bacterium]|nr:helix-turn-helix transcriptional regulator [Planctomycetia bacterium]